MKNTRKIRIKRARRKRYLARRRAVAPRPVQEAKPELPEHDLGEMLAGMGIRELRDYVKTRLVPVAKGQGRTKAGLREAIRSWASACWEAAV